MPPLIRFRETRARRAVLQAVGLLRRAIAVHLTPDDDERDRLRLELARCEVAHRFGAIGRTGSIARIERGWRTLKDALSQRPLAPLRFSTCEAAVRAVLHWYTWYRPHTALEGQTPAERYFGVPLRAEPRSPPRGQPGEDRGAPPFTVAWLDAEPSLPLLLPRSA